MSATCEKCKGFGETLRGTGIYDCHEPGCTAAVDRTALEESLPAAAVCHPFDMLWVGYMEGVAKASLRQTYWDNVAAGLVEVKTAAQRAAEDRHHKPHAVYVEQEVAELRARLGAMSQKEVVAGQ